MADWEKAPMKVREENIRQFAGLNQGFNTDNTKLAEGISDEDIPKQIALLEAQRDGWEKAPSKEDGWEKAETGFGAKLKGLGETALSMATGGGATVLGGLAAIPFAAVGGVESGVEALKWVQDKAYTPKTDKGKEYSATAGEFLDKTIKGAAPALEGAINPFGMFDDQITPEQRESIGLALSEVGSNFIPLEMGTAIARGRASARTHAADASRKLNTEVKSPAVPETPLPELNMEGVAPHLGKAEINSVVPETPLPELNIWDGTQTKGFPKLRDDFEGAAPIKNEVAPMLEDPLSPARREAREQADIEGRYMNGEDFNQPPSSGTAYNNLDAKRGIIDDLEKQYNEMQERLYNLSDEARTASKKRLEEISKESRELLEAQQSLVQKRISIEKDGSFRTEYNPIDNGLTETFAKAQEEAYRKAEAEQQAQLKEAAFREIEILKQRQMVEMENQRQLDIARQAGEIDFMELKRQGDTSLMEDRATGFMFEALQRGQLSKALETISGMHTSSGYRSLARYLEDKITSLKVKLHDSGVIVAGERAYTGYFDSASNTVGFSRQGALSPHTVLHEVVHALTSQFMHLKPDHFLTKGIKNVYEQARKKPGFDKFSHIVNEREFLAEAFSNKEFQQWLKKQYLSSQGPARTAWTKFVHGVKSMLGIKPGHLSDALTTTVDLGKQIMEHSNENFRNKAKERLAAEGIPNKMLDLMAAKKPQPLAETRNVEPWKKLPGLKHAVEDFAFFDKKPEEVVAMVKEFDDIPDNVAEKLSQKLQGGALFESLKTRNPVVKATYEWIKRATQEAADDIATKLTDPKTGLKSYMRNLTKEQKAEIWLQDRMDEGHVVRTAEELAMKGYDENQIAYHMKRKELDQEQLERINTVREQIGLKPIEARTAHLAGLYMGPFSRFAFKDGKMIAPIHASTRGGLNRAVKWMSENHPEYTWGKVNYKEIGKGKSASDRFGGLMEAINFIEKADGNVAALFESYREYIKTDANNIFNVRRHEKPKAEAAGGRQGSEGNKPWLDAVKNAEEGMKAQLDYFEQGYTWMAMQKAMEKVNKVIGDETVVEKMPKAVEWATKYRDHALGVNQDFVADFSNSLLSHVGKMTGVGHTNILKASNTAKHLMMQKFMGFFNFPFTTTQLMQPFQSHPAMLTLLKHRGMEFSIAEAQVKATEGYMASLWPQLLEKADPFNKQAIEYAKRHRIFDVKLADHTKDINVSPIKENFDKMADMNITAPEHLTRGTAFFFYTHVLKKAGIPEKDIFSAAENMVDFTMTNYQHIERPMVYSHLGWVGDLAATLTRYKHNQYSQAAFYAREGVRGAREGSITASAPLALFVGTSVAFSGLMGMWGFNEADQLYQLFTEKVLNKPDTLTNAVLASDAPEYLTHGVFATLGIDMSSRFSHAKTIPENPAQFLMPYGSALFDIFGTTYDLAKNRDEVSFKRWGKAIAPSSIQGHIENEFFTKKQEDGSNMYISPTNLKGKTTRSDGDMAKRQWGLRTVRESKELAGNYSDLQISQANDRLREKVMDKAERLYASGDLTPEKARELAKEYVQYEGDGNGFGSRLSQFAINQRTTELQRQLLNGSIYDKQRAMKRSNASK